MTEITKADLGYIKNYARNQVQHLDQKEHKEELTVQERSDVAIFQRIFELADGIIVRHSS